MFQTLFDTIFSPQIMGLILEYYLPAQQYSFLFHPSHTDIVTLSTQLQILLSDITEHLLTTLYLYSYFSCICSKPSSPEIQPITYILCSQPTTHIQLLFSIYAF